MNDENVAETDGILILGYIKGAFIACTPYNFSVKSSLSTLPTRTVIFPPILLIQQLNFQIVNSPVMDRYRVTYYGTSNYMKMRAISANKDSTLVPVPRRIMVFQMFVRELVQ